jgi:hypothetical protein
MISAITSTLKTATWAFLLLSIAMYMFGVAIAQTVAELKQEREAEGNPLAGDDPLLRWFGSFPRALYTLFLAITGGIDYQISSDHLMVMPMSFGLYIFYIVLSTFCVMNVVTGIFCQNAIETFENDKENLIDFKLQEKERFVETLTGLIKDWDTTGDGKCTREEFEKHVSDPRMQLLLRTLDIDARDACQLFTMMDVDGSGYLDLDEFVHGCITLRGAAKAVHMEKSLIDNKVANNKLDRILRTLRTMGVRDEHLNRAASRPISSRSQIPSKDIDHFGDMNQSSGDVGARPPAWPPASANPEPPKEEVPHFTMPGANPDP